MNYFSWKVQYGVLSRIINHASSKFVIIMRQLQQGRCYVYFHNLKDLNGELEVGKEESTRNINMMRNKQKRDDFS